MDADTIARVLIDVWFTRYGPPRTMRSDRGGQFVSKIVAKINDIFGVAQRHTSSYHPQADGLVERFNKTLESMIASYVGEFQRDWDVYLPLLLFAYRTAVQESIGDSPFFMTFGREPHTRLDLALRPISNATSPRRCGSPPSVCRTIVDGYGSGPSHCA